jgi:hypothetical protein
MIVVRDFLSRLQDPGRIPFTACQLACATFLSTEEPHKQPYEPECDEADPSHHRY